MGRLRAAGSSGVLVTRRRAGYSTLQPQTDARSPRHTSFSVGREQPASRCAHGVDLRVTALLAVTAILEKLSTDNIIFSDDEHRSRRGACSLFDTIGKK